MLSKLPLHFEPNVGQAGPDVRFVAHAPGGLFLFSPSGVSLSLQTGKAGVDGSAPAGIVTMRFVGADGAPQIAGKTALVSKVNYLRGSDPGGWRTGVSTYDGIIYTGLYPGIGLSYVGGAGRLKGTYLVGAGADPGRVRWSYEGASRVHVDGAGDLQIEIDTAKSKVAGSIFLLTEQAPVAWQDIEGQRVPVSVRYSVAADESVSFALGSYNPAYPMVIDPTLAYSTYFGGDNNDVGHSIAIDAAGNVYVTGRAQSSNFPLANPLQPTRRGFQDAFVSKISSDGSTLVFSTYLGGSDGDDGRSIAVDAAGNVYVAGTTSSTDFPVVNAFQPAFGGSFDGFISKLNAAGSALVYSTYLGGSSGENVNAIAVDMAGNAYATGTTTSDNFPAHNAIQPARAGMQDAFVSKFSAAGSALVYSTYLGGTGTDTGFGVTVDTAGNAFLSGETGSTDFPVRNALQPTSGGGDDIFITRVNSSGTQLDFSTYLGGSSLDGGGGITLDSTGNIYLAGASFSADFPTALPFQPSLNGVSDAVVVKVDAMGTRLLYSTFLGGSGPDSANAIAFAGGNIYVTGSTSSPDFPIANAIQPNLGDTSDAFVTKLSPSGLSLVYSTYLGGANYGSDRGEGIAADTAGNAYVIGHTLAVDFPTVNALQAQTGGGYDAFISKISDPAGTTPTISPTGTPAATTPTLTATASFTAVPTHTATGTATPTPVGPASPTNTPAATNTPVPSPTGTPTPCAITFSDVQPSDYFYGPVRYLYCSGAVSGYADNTFRPYNNATRGQLTKIVVLAEGWAVECPSAGHFNDVPTGSAFYCFVETAYSRGIISGYGCGTGCLEFRPGNSVTRGQISKIVVLAQSWSIYTPPAPTFQDVPAGSPFFTFVETAYNHGIISGYGCGAGCLEFRPGNNATRGQISKIVYGAVGRKT